MLSLDVATHVGDLAIQARLTVPDGRCLAVTGPSGAGKTSLLRVIAGLLAPEHGRISCGDESWLDTDRRVDLPPERRPVGFVFQDHALFGHLSAWRNVAYGMRGRDRRARATALLARVGLAGRADARPRELSGGERQRVALARALAREPRVLLLDEPLSALDTRTRAAAARLLGEVLRESGVPAVLVTHDFGDAALLADRVAVLDGGRVVQEGTAAELTARPATAFVADLSGASVLTGTARPAGDLTAVTLDGGGTVLSTDPAGGAVSVALHPWDVGVEPTGSGAGGSARNRLDAVVVSVTRIGNRVRIGLETPQPLVAEVTGPGADALQLAPGTRVTATFKASATRLI